MSTKASLCQAEAWRYGSPKSPDWGRDIDVWDDSDGIEEISEETRRVCEKFGKGPAGKGCGLYWIHDGQQMEHSK